MQGIQQEKYGVSRYFILTVLLSFLGWIFETAYMRIACGRWIDRGFLTLPLCIIYGCSLVGAYLLLGLPSGGGILIPKRFTGATRTFFYLFYAFLLPSLLEYAVGLFFDRKLGLRLWDYSYQTLQIGGYVSLRNSLVWAVGIYFFMRYAFPVFYRWVGGMQSAKADKIAYFLLAVILFDFSCNFVRVFYM